MSPPYFLYAQYRPRSAAALAAEHFWIVQAERCRTAVECALPDSSVDIYFNFGPSGRQPYSGSQPGQPAWRAAWVIGPRAHNLLIEKEIRSCDVVGVRMRTGAAAQLLGVPAHELQGALVDLDNFWGCAAESMRDELAGAPTIGRRFQVLERLMEERVARADAAGLCGAQAVCSALSHEPAATVASAAAQLGMTHRKVIRFFDEAVGLKPRMYQRVQRLRRAFRAIRRTATPEWARLASECGFYDQAHLINEFRKLTGYTPAEYAAGRSHAGDGYMPFLLAVPAG